VTQAQGRKEAHALWTGLLAEYDRYKKAVSYIPSRELRLQEDLRRYLCLRCAGFLEQLTYLAITDFLERTSSGPTQAFATSFFRTAPNLGVDPFVRLIGRFGSKYEEKLGQFLSSTRKDALSDLMSVRNDIAHGKYHAGRKLDPDRYIRLCKDIYDWYLEDFLEQIVVTEMASTPDVASKP
jgi:hypothetical protein